MSSRAAPDAAHDSLLAALTEAGVPLSDDTGSYAVARSAPAAAARPASVEEVSAALAAASRLGAAVVPWGGGTRQGLGAPPARYDLALDLTGLDRVVAHEPADMTVTVQAGCTIDAMNEALAPAGQWLPLDPPLASRATVGGTLAVGLGGPLAAGYGSPREQVIGMRAVLADGTVVKSGGNVVKNVTGYAMDRLHIGALGTLGVIVEATFKVAPLPRAEATLVGDMPDVHAAAAACNAAMAAGLPIIAAEAGRSGLWGIRGWTLALRVAGRPAAVERAAAAVAEACRAHGGALAHRLDGAESAALGRTLADLGRMGPGLFAAMRASVPPARGPEAVDALLAEGDGIIALGIPQGVVRWFDIAQGLDQAAMSSVAHVRRHGAALRGRIAALGGSLTTEGAQQMLAEEDPLFKDMPPVDPWGPPGADFAVMRRLKEQFDPQGTLNPGRFVGGI